MIQEVYCLYDKASDSFVGSLMLFVSEKVAVRSLRAFCNDPNFPYHAFRDDMAVYRLGTMNLGTGELVCDKKFISDVMNLTINSHNKVKE